MFGFKRTMLQAVAFLSWTLHYYTFGNLLLWSFFTTLLTAAVLLAITTYDHDYWNDRGVFSPPAWPVVGHILSVVRFKEQGGMCFKRIYETYRNVRFLGTHQFYQRTLVICDPELIKRICVNDFQHFVDRGFFFNKDVDPLAGSVLFLRGNEWRRLRAKISPIFSPIKLRGMFSLIDDTAKDFVVRIKEVLEAKYKENSKENGLHNIENNNFSNINKNNTENKLEKIYESQKEDDSAELIKGSERKNMNGKIPTLVDLNKEIYKYIGGNEYSMVNEKGNVAPTYVNKENKNMNGNVLLNKEDKENHYVIDEIEENKNRNGKVGLAENEIANGKANYIKSAETKTAIGNVFSDTNKIKKEIHDVRGVVSAAVDSEKLVGGYTADAIVPCAFGLKSRVMYNDKDPFAVALQSFYEMSVFNIFEKTMRQFWPAFVLFFRMRIIPKKTHDFFYNIVTSVVRARQNGEQEKRGDFIDMMMALRSDDTNNINKTADDVEITDMVISANAFIIFLGGFETTSSTLAFLFMELAAHPRVQDTMREEILRLMEKHDGNISYELLQELNYMEMVIQETLRLYPPFPSIQRMCTKDYTLPGTSVLVERGTIVLFPTLGIQRDERYFDNGKAFIPERWSEGSPQPPPGVYMPFGDGPRYCIGKRFAMIQMKSCLVRLLQRVRISPARPSMLAERRAEPFAPDPRSPLTLHPADSLVKLSLL